MTTIKRFKLENWSNYQLIDSGNQEKLEKFGKYIIARPEPQALWDKNLLNEEWEDMAHAFFRRDEDNPEIGHWHIKDGMPDRWYIHYKGNNDLALQFKLSLSSFKHVGIFPEQALNWEYIYERCTQLNQPKVLNLFAYTGAASLAAKAAGAEVTHVDSIKQVITWARENMEASKLDNIRWMVEDAAKFVKREIRRGNKYQGIILDPPAYGRGPQGEKWILEDGINEIMRDCAQLLDKQNHFVVVNLYSLGFSTLILENLIKSSFEGIKNLEVGELVVEDKGGYGLPLGILGRFHNLS